MPTNGSTEFNDGVILSLPAGQAGGAKDLARFFGLRPQNDAGKKYKYETYRESHLR